MGNGVVIYDIETYPNCFLLGVVDLYSDAQFMFELSDRKDESSAMFEFLYAVRDAGATMIGYNNLNFDYPVIHELLKSPGFATYKTAYEKADSIINAKNRWGHQIWPDQRFARQIDLFKLNHFDNIAKSTSLKELQFVMRAPSVEDLPIPPGTVLTPEQIDETAIYCVHDIEETKRFVIRCWPDIAFRYSLLERFGEEVLNWSDVKIGGEYLIKELGWNTCYYKDSNGRRQPRQTERDEIPVKDIIFPYVSFRTRECNELLAYMKSRVIRDTRSAVSASCELDGFKFDFGTGGIHGSKHKSSFHADGRRVIIDADVTSLYPSIAIENGLAPEHLGEKFVEKYRELRDERKKHPKKTPINAALKLALNGTYGNSNNVWSPFFDPKFTMSITINGQLLLLMLAERLLEVPTLELIQINTDGVTFRVVEDYEVYAMNVCSEWEKLTKLSLEYVSYSAFFCRDVNNYIAVDIDGNVKRKGAYDFPEKDEDYLGWWHRNYSSLVVQKAASAFLIDGTAIDKFVTNHQDPYDFMLRVKCPRASKMIWDSPTEGPKEQQRITRYFASLDGGQLYKESPPVEGVTPGQYKRRANVDLYDYLKVMKEIGPDVWDERIHTKNKSVYDERVMKIHDRASICNHVDKFSFETLDYEWYINEVKKLVDFFV